MTIGGSSVFNIVASINTVKDMKEQILKIAEQLQKDQITTKQAQTLLLDLFGGSKSVTCHHPLPYRKSTGQYTNGFTCTLCGKFVSR